MSRLGAIVVRLALTFTFVWVGFALFLDPWRRVEANGIAGIVHLFGTDRVSAGYANQLLVIPTGARPFFATISPSCSAIAAVLAFGAVTIFLVTGPVSRRVLAFVAASTFVVVCNLVRIAGSILVGLDSSSHGLVIFHDWVGRSSDCSRCSAGS